MNVNGRLMLFGLNVDRSYSDRVSHALDVAVSEHEERIFEDGELKCRPLSQVTRADVFVVQSLYSEPGRSVNDKLCQLLFFIGALKDAGADRVTVVAPYFCYARKDQRTQFQDPVTTRYIAALFEAVGMDALMTFDVHNVAAFENAFRRRTLPLSARSLFADYFRDMAVETEAVVVAPDFGGAKRAEALRRDLAAVTGHELGTALVEKYRGRGMVSGGMLTGDVKDKAAIIYDDMISSGNTVRRAAQACRDKGALRVYAAATHVLRNDVVRALADDPLIDHLVVTNTVPHPITPRLQILDTTHLLAHAIRTAHCGHD